MLSCLSTAHRIAGDRYRICPADSKWSGAPLQCVPLCPSLGCEHCEQVNGTCAGACDALQCELRCAPGYRASGGDPTRTCGSDGNWTGAALQCEALPTCPTANH